MDEKGSLLVQTLRRLADDKDLELDDQERLDMHEAADSLHLYEIAEENKIDEQIAAMPEDLQEESAAHMRTLFKLVQTQVKLKETLAELERKTRALASADERAVRWEDKVQHYGREVSSLKDELADESLFAAMLLRDYTQLSDAVRKVTKPWRDQAGVNGAEIDNLCHVMETLDADKDKKEMT